MDEKDNAELVHLLTEQQGLSRANKLFPDTIKAAAERGLRPLAPLPAGTSPLIAPALQFDPARYEPRK